MSECAWAEAQLPLRPYGGELSDAERERLGAHLAGCSACAEVAAALEAAGEALDELPLEQPDPERYAGLKARVLAAVAEPCPREAELSAAGVADLPAELRVHLEECPACRTAARELRGLGRALDALPAPALEASAREALRARVLAATTEEPLASGCAREAELVATWEEPAPELTAHLVACSACQETRRELSGLVAALQRVPCPPRSEADRAELRAAVLAQVRPPAGRLVRFPGWALRAAAVLLVATFLGLGAASQFAPRQPTELSVLLQEAESLTRDGDLGGAMARLDAVLLRSGESGDPERTALARRAEAQLAALRKLRPGTTAAGATRGSILRIERPRLEQVIREDPDTPAALFAIRRWYDTGHMAFDSLTFPDERFKNINERTRTKQLRLAYAGLQQQVRVELTDPRLVRQAVFLQRGLHAEELGLVAEARRHYQEAVALGTDSKAGRLAAERLEALG